MRGKLMARRVGGVDRLQHYILGLNVVRPLDETCRDRLTEIAEPIQHHIVGADLACEGDANAIPRIMLSGWACRQRSLADGRRQIFGFILPGDGLAIPDDSALAGVLCTVTALTPVTTMQASTLRALIAAPPPEHEGLAQACQRAACLDEVRLLDHIVRLGRQSAQERVAHLLLELHDRMAKVGLAFEGRFPMPLTQEVLADALGLSIVHLNRTLQQLRRSGVIDTRAGWVSLRDVEQMQFMAQYRPAHQTLRAIV